MDLGLSRKNVLITGGSKGIGLACAKAFRAEGARVAIVSRSRENLEAAKKILGEAYTIAADLIDASAAAAMVERVEKELGPIDVLVNSAGAAKRTDADELTPAAWRAGMDAKYFSYINVIDPVVKRMAARGRGAIVNIIGMGGKVASPVHLPGGAANAALMLATTGLAAAFGPKGIRINAINPGATLTGRVQEGLKAESKMTGLTEAELLERNQARIPLGRLGTPEEVAQVAMFLASDQASYVTGGIVPMDGGSGSVI
jgi:NAD(P)-dependent dehydrogenase (short-subunit alcohol dehydrogenase family)